MFSFNFILSGQEHFTILHHTIIFLCTNNHLMNRCGNFALTLAL